MTGLFFGCVRLKRLEALDDDDQQLLTVGWQMLVANNCRLPTAGLALRDRTELAAAWF